MNDLTNDWAPAKKAEATTNISTLNYSTSTAVRSAIPLQAEIDILDTFTVIIPVFEEFRIGSHDDLEAVRIGGQAIQRKAHHAQVARTNRGL